PRPAGEHAEFRAALAARLVDIVGLLGRKWSCPDAGRVGLTDTKDVIDCAGTHTGTGRRLRRHRVRGCDERIGAMVDVEQRALRAFEQDAFALAPAVVEP